MKKITVNDVAEKTNVSMETVSAVMNGTDVVKAISYINANWDAQEMWDSWGDTRIQVDDFIKRKRAREIMNLHLSIAKDFHKTLLGKEFNVLVDVKKSGNMYLARNDNYNLVVVRSDNNLLGKFINVKITKSSAHYVYGRIS